MSITGHSASSHCGDSSGSDGGVMNAPFVQALLDELRDLKPYGAELHIHERTGMPLKTIAEQIATVPKKRASLLLVLELLREIQDGSEEGEQHALRLFRRIAAGLGYSVMLTAAGSTEGGPLAQLANVTKELGDVAGLCRGPLNDELRRRLDTEAIELIEAVHGLRRSLSATRQV